MCSPSSLTHPPSQLNLQANASRIGRAEKPTVQKTLAYLDGIRSAFRLTCPVTRLYSQVGFGIDGTAVYAFMAREKETRRTDDSAGPT